MSEVTEKLLVGCVAAFLGFLLGITSKPIQEYFELIKEIRQSLIQFANCYGSNARQEKSDAAKDKYREFSGRLASVPHLKLYYLYRFLNLVPDKESLFEAGKEFIRLSNLIITDDFESMRKVEARIRQRLQLEARED